jgi:spore maturation protein CgeB
LHGDYVSALARSRIVVNGVDTFGSLNWKFLEPCACGAMLLTEESEDMERLGFVSGLNCVVFNGIADLKDKILYAISHEAELQSLAMAGYQLVKTRHSNVVRVQELTAQLEKEI